MSYGDHTSPTGVERWIEARLPGYRFGGVLLLLFATFVFMASGVDGPWARVVTVGLQGLTLLAALLASCSGRRLFRIAAIVVIISFVSTIVSALADSSDGATGAFFILNVLLVAGAPIVIVRALWKRQVVDVHTVLGAICVYVLIGMLFAFVYGSIGLIGDDAFFAETSSANIADFLYFSFVTITTVGYGDFTAAHGLGRGARLARGAARADLPGDGRGSAREPDGARWSPGRGIGDRAVRHLGVTDAAIARPGKTPPLQTARVARGCLGRRELLGHDREAAVPERRVGEVEADDRAQLLGRASTLRLASSSR